MDKNELDLLKKIEDLTAQMNKSFKERGDMIFSRYPLTFALLVIFGATLVSQGMKDFMLKIPFFQNQPLIMLLTGIVILLLTGTLYKKLKK